MVLVVVAGAIIAFGVNRRHCRNDTHKQGNENRLHRSA